MKAAVLVVVGTCILSAILWAQGRQNAAVDRIVHARIGPVAMQLFVAAGDGSGEHELLRAPIDSLPPKNYSPSFSPDGQWIVFTSEHDGTADIYRVHPDGTGLERLTDDPAYDDQATLSPDGKTLAFVSSRVTGRAHVWLMDIATRRARNLTNNSGSDFRPAWSPDGQWLAFTSDRERPLAPRMGQWELIQWNALYVIRPDGTDLRRLTSVGAQKEFAGSPKWSRDGTRIIYYETTADGAYHAQTGTPVRGETQLISIDVKSLVRTGHTTGDSTKLWPQWLPDGAIGYLEKFPNGDAELQIRRGNAVVAKSPRAQLRNPSWSSDGKQVTYCKILPDPAGTGLMREFSRDPAFDLTMATSWFQAFSPDGDKLAVAASGGGRVEVMNPDGSDRRVVFSQQGAQSVAPAWSPDGRRIAFSVGRFFRASGYPPAEIAVVDADGTGLRTVVKDDANNGFPTWSPDGTRLVYKKDQHLAIVSLRDNKETTLTEPGPQHDNFPQWSPKGDVIVFDSDRQKDGDYRLYSIKPDGTGLRQIPNSTPGDGHPAFSPDGEYIMFSSARMGFKDERPLVDRGPQPYAEIFIMRLDGTGLRQLTDNQWEDALPTWLPKTKTSRSDQTAGRH